MSPKQIKAIRHALGLTQQQLASTVGADRVTVTRWETGVRAPTGAYVRTLEGLKLKAEGKPVPRTLDPLFIAIAEAIKGKSLSVDNLPKQRKESKKRGRKL